jgi:hypothetical protein
VRDDPAAVTRAPRLLELTQQPTRFAVVLVRSQSVV